MVPTACCPDCTWSYTPRDADDDLVAASVALEQHLLGEHDVTFSRVGEIVRGWFDGALDATRPPLSETR